MTKLHKSLLAVGTLASVAAPIAAVVSCGAETVNPDTTIVVQAEKSWIPTYNKIINAFKADPAIETAMKAAGIDKIQVKEMGSFDVEGSFKTKGKLDPSTPDLFLYAMDKMNLYTQGGYLKPFAEKTVDAFAKNAGVTFNSSTAKTRTSLEHDGKLYGAPENVEAMVKMSLKNGAHKDQSITKFSDLWMSNGYFNTADFNLRDIVYTDTNGPKPVVKTAFGTAAYNHDTVDTKDEADKAVIAGFENVLKAAEPIDNISALDADSAKATPTINGYVKKGYALYAGPWDANKIKVAAGGEIEAEAVPTSDKWEQFGGGWAYGMNARMKDDKAALVEKLISWFYKPEYAQEMFTKVGKASPTVEGEAKITNLTFDAAASGIPSATYATAVVLKPQDQAFQPVWAIYANEIALNKGAIKELTNEAKTDQKLVDLATKMAKDFEKGVEQSAVTANSLHN